MERDRIALLRVADPDWIRIQSGQWIRIRIQEGQNDPQKSIKIVWMASFAVLWIRIHFSRIRIRIQSFPLETNTDPDPDSGSG
jgi:hypothetical protein